MNKTLDFKKWLLEVGDATGGDTPTLQLPVGAQLRGVADQGCDAAGGFPCISLNKENLPPKKKMSKQKR